MVKEVMFVDEEEKCFDKHIVTKKMEKPKLGQP